MTAPTCDSAKCVGVLVDEVGAFFSAMLRARDAAETRDALAESARADAAALAREAPRARDERMRAALVAVARAAADGVLGAPTIAGALEVARRGARLARVVRARLDEDADIDDDDVEGIACVTDGEDSESDDDEETSDDRAFIDDDARTPIDLTSDVDDDAGAAAVSARGEAVLAALDDEVAARYATLRVADDAVHFARRATQVRRAFERALDALERVADDAPSVHRAGIVGMVRAAAVELDATALVLDEHAADAGDSARFDIMGGAERVFGTGGEPSARDVRAYVRRARRHARRAAERFECACAALAADVERACDVVGERLARRAAKRARPSGAAMV